MNIERGFYLERRNISAHENIGFAPDGFGEDTPTTRTPARKACRTGLPGVLFPTACPPRPATENAGRAHPPRFVKSR